MRWALDLSLEEEVLDSLQNSTLSLWLSVFSTHRLVTSHPQVIQVTFPQLPSVHLHQVSQRTESLYYHSSHPWHTLSQILSHHLLTNMQFSRPSPSVMVGFLLCLSPLYHPVTSWSEEIQSGTQCTSLEQFTWGPVRVAWGVVW